MITTDSDFVVLYFMYGIVLTLILFCLFFGNKKEYLIHLVIYLLYTIFMISIFTDKENFSSGGSLVVVFYGLVFPILHIIGYGITKFIKFIRKN
ncbi:hypothetical protein IMCC3317_17220 [Kordia antarctica]|uniref:Uncharacterized protein n=1 Tax=Kordia antarctica TaxID=1218801 RepID=A0A7L4ZIK9_9FLAO|nr:hypothetical protein IMCC3317_17220 [Kordia antarctica]